MGLYRDSLVGLAKILHIIQDQWETVEGFKQENAVLTSVVFNAYSDSNLENTERGSGDERCEFWN